MNCKPPSMRPTSAKEAPMLWYSGPKHIDIIPIQCNMGDGYALFAYVETMRGHGVEVDSLMAGVIYESIADAEDAIVDVIISE